MLPSPTAPRSRHAVGWPREVGILHNGNRQRVPSEYAYYSNVISSGRRAEYNFFSSPYVQREFSNSQLRTGNAPSPGRSGPPPRRRSKWLFASAMKHRTSRQKPRKERSASTNGSG